MRISLIGPVYPYRGGISLFTSYLAKAFEELGYNLQIVSFKRQYPKWLYPGDSDLDPSREHDPVPAEYILDPLRPNTWRKAVRAIKAFQSEIVVIEWWTVFWGPAYFLISKFLRRSGIFVIFLIHNVLPHEERPWDRFLARLVLRQGNGFLVQTEREQQRLVDVVGERNFIRMQPHPIYDIAPKTMPTMQQARISLGLPENVPVVLFFGIVRPYKGLNILLEAISILNQTESCFLVIAGEFWQSEGDYQEQVGRLGINNQVMMINRYIPNEDLPTIFAAIDVFSAAYLEGTQSGTTSMALGFGCKVVVSEKVARGLPGEFLKSVVIVPSGDPHALAEGIKKALHEQKPEATVKSNRRDWKEFAQALVELAIQTDKPV